MSPFFRTLIFTVIVPGFWTVGLPHWLLPSGTRPDFSGAGLLGGLLIAAGVALYLLCAFWGFALRGGGTPAPRSIRRGNSWWRGPIAWCGIRCTGVSLA